MSNFVRCDVKGCNAIQGPYNYTGELPEKWRNIIVHELVEVPAEKPNVVGVQGVLETPQGPMQYNQVMADIKASRGTVLRSHTYSVHVCPKHPLPEFEEDATRPDAHTLAV